MELILWHEPGRVTHAEAAARARLLPRPFDCAPWPPAPVTPVPVTPVPAAPPQAHAAIGDMSGEVGDLIAGTDDSSYLWLRLKDSAVPRIRYLAGKHRLVCFDPRWQAVLNPPLLRRSGGYELSLCVGHTIDDPAPEHVERAVRELTPANWFVVLEDGDDHYVQAALTGEGYLLEVRDGSADKHLQTRVSSGERVIHALRSQASGGSGWRSEFEWTAWH